MTIKNSSIDKTNLYIGIFVWLVVFIVYNITKAPTLSFWDCGEFIAACVQLQIPHPPGSPFYIVLGRVFSMIPMVADLAVRINMLSVISSSFTAFFGYLVAVHILKKTISIDGSLLSRIMIYGGGACGAFLVAFGHTNWNNSVEAEVYGLSMMLTMAVFWLALIYWEHKGTAFSEKVMYLIFFLAFLGVGVHMTSYLIIPVLAVFFITKLEISKHFWFIFGVIFLFELYVIFAFSSQAGEIPYYLPLLIVFIVFLFYIFSFEKIESIYLFVGAGFSLSVLPLLGDLLYKSDPARFESIKNVLDPIGKGGFAVLICLGLYLFFVYLKSRKTNQVKNHHLIASLFIGVSALMVLFFISDSWICRIQTISCLNGGFRRVIFIRIL